MKLTRIQISNIVGARAVDVSLTKPITMFAGHNYSGKSSIQEAVRMALTGESVRVALKKDYASLITEGQDAGFAEVTAGAESFSVVLPSGKGQHSTDTALPYVLDAQRFATLTPNDRRAFLFGLTGLQCNGFHVGGRLVARGCDPAKVEKIAPSLRAGFDAAQKEAATKARECKAQWKTTTGGETYGSVKAATWAAVKPAFDGPQLKQAKADLARMEDEIEAETRRHGDMQGRAQAQQNQAGKLANLRETAGRYARIGDNLNRAEAELMEWTAKVEATRVKAVGVIPEAHHECPHCGGAIHVIRHNGGLAAEVIKYTKPEGTPPDPEAVANLPEYERALKVMDNTVANLKRDLATADAAARTLTELEGDSKEDPAPAPEEIDALKARIDVLKHSRANQQAAIRLLEDSEREAKQADKRTVDAAAHHVNVQQWDAIVDALAPDGIPGEMLAEALGPINERLTISSNTSEWSRIGIDADMTITAEGGRSYSLLSESEKWRADAMIAEAIAHLSGIRLLVLDRFDVLDIKGREDLLYWLDAMAEDGEIDTALVFGTLKALPAQLPDTVAAFWIENGVTGHMKQAA